MTDRATDVRAVAARAMQALRSGDARGAREGLKQALEATPSDPGLWLNLALAERALDDNDAELAAIEKGLALDPRSLVGLLLKGDWYERHGRARDAGAAFTAALQVAPPFEHLPGELKAPVHHAWEVSQTHAREREAFLRRFVADAADRMGDDQRDRFDEAMDIMLGKKAVYRQQPHVLFWPGLPTIQFFDRRLFPFLDPVEAATDAIREEAIKVLAADQGLDPYINYPDSTPLDQWRELNRSLDWSAYHLVKDGRRIDAHCAACPDTMQALADVPGPRIGKHCPVTMFSVLKPRTRIPPHTGVTNARLVVHLPLIVPPDCVYRVGNDAREWVEGKAWVFDDTIEHEAQNNSDRVRVVLIFDVWNPFLREAEKPLVDTIISGLDAFGDEAAKAEW